MANHTLSIQNSCKILYVPLNISHLYHLQCLMYFMYYQVKFTIILKKIILSLRNIYATEQQPKVKKCNSFEIPFLHYVSPSVLELNWLKNV